MNSPEPLTPVVWDAAKSREYFASIQDENGVDLTLIRDNFRRPPLERLRRGEEARLGVLRLRMYAKRVTPEPA